MYVHLSLCLAEEMDSEDEKELPDIKDDNDSSE